MDTLQTGREIGHTVYKVETCLVRNVITVTPAGEHVLIIHVTLDHKTSHKGQFIESWINTLSIDVWL